MIVVLNLISGLFIRLLSFAIVGINSKMKKDYKAIKLIIHQTINGSSNVPPLLNFSIIKSEDKRFYQHLGVDFYSILRAFKNIVYYNRLEGASTINQQLVRNLTNNREITIKRKFREIVFATVIDTRFSKNDILVAYLNSYRFGNKTGVINFCRVEKFNLNNLTATDSAQITARIKYPTVTKQNYIRYLKRVRKIEILLSKEGEVVRSRIWNKLPKNTINSSEFEILSNFKNTVSEVA